MWLENIYASSESSFLILGPHGRTRILKGYVNYQFPTCIYGEQALKKQTVSVLISVLATVQPIHVPVFYPQRSRFLKAQVVT